MKIQKYINIFYFNEKLRFIGAVKNQFPLERGWVLNNYLRPNLEIELRWYNKPKMN